MLTDPKEIALVANAKQRNVRDPKRSRRHFVRIFDDFFKGVELSGRYIDLGPGQFDFGEIVRENGGTCVGVDFDTAVLDLGRYKGFDVVELNLKKLDDYDFGDQFDGVFNKFSINAFWTPAEAEHERIVAAVTALIKPGGWGWIGPWNRVPKAANYSKNEIEAILEKQKVLFEAAGFQTINLTWLQRRRYGLHGKIANSRVFLKNLERRPRN